MAAPSELLWNSDPHTRAKHDMLARYLEAWFPIMAASRWSSSGATYAEGFAGPGEYLNGGPGSPILALQAASRPEVAKHATDLRMIFVEKSQARLEHLKALVERRGFGRGRVHITYVGRPCETHLLPALDDAGAWAGPIFVNLDGWGVDTPYTIVERIGQSRSSEVLITLQTQWFARFASVENLRAGDIVFGESGWRGVANQPANEKRRFLADRYLGRLRDAGFNYTLTFEMVDEGGNGLFLVFGTDDLLGVQKMKDAMWSVDKVRGQRFRDPRDLAQLTFEAIDSDPDLTLLGRQVLERLDVGPQSIDALKTFALRETMFKKTHVDAVVADFVAKRKVVRTKARRDADAIVTLAPETLF